MDEYILKHLQDILNAIADLDKIFHGYPLRFDVFEKDDPLFMKGMHPTRLFE